ncbi:hypothetical protein CC77DRAFT_1073068 [Alternaria alternata]|jgi:hypothetical protein|uniref:Uncharacterized protein n=1 Tax=Alternaria alternata TaxID=5599 RepID=A0A177DGT5_ALTAL|nr:hypothetical protein CC77DRAFT_1073068 [Alternaria alternata]OAG18975.1 hypothetical protein CC77DRAFT_1073068 [Alternaria alternata]
MASHLAVQCAAIHCAGFQRAECASAPHETKLITECGHCSGVVVRWYEYEHMPRWGITSQIPRYTALMFFPFPLQYDYLLPGTMAPQRRPSIRYDALSSINSYSLFPSSRKAPSIRSTRYQEPATAFAWTTSKHVQPYTTSTPSPSRRADISCGIQFSRLFSPRRRIAPRRDHRIQRIYVPTGYQSLDFSSWETYSETAREFQLYA